MLYKNNKKDDKVAVFLQIISDNNKIMSKYV
jgi:hypothetical protein